jgi:hypothetical protein
MTSNKLNLPGQKFGKLTILEKGNPIFNGKRFHGTWKCLCECGKEKIIKTVNLNRGTTNSCGCIKKEPRNNYKSGDKFNRLTLKKFYNGEWICTCDCGKEISVKTERLKGNTKSCGCLKIESAKKKYNPDMARKWEPRIASAMRVYSSYEGHDKDFDLTFDQFYELTQQNCIYCGIEPSKKYNYFINSDNEKSRLEGEFIYNGIDRVDSDSSHTIKNGNCVTACIDCNRAKSDYSLHEFLNWIDNLKEDPEIFYWTKISLPDNNYIKTSINSVWYNYKAECNLTMEEFYSISQMNCYYCGKKPSNNFNYSRGCKKSSEKAKKQGDFIYNGLDRLNSSNPKHDAELVVSCCKQCNQAKSDLSLKDFYIWIKRIKNYQIV